MNMLKELNKFKILDLRFEIVDFRFKIEEENRGISDCRF